MILLIDNYDSFTYNLFQQIQKLTDLKVKIIKNDRYSINEIMGMDVHAVVISPGPGNPKNKNDFGICTQVIKYYEEKVPILGICLGHQGIGIIYGGTIKNAENIFHGKTSEIVHNSSSIFIGCKQKLRVMRYHSLSLANLEYTPLESIAFSMDNEIMGIKHKDYPIYGFQFHPESFLTEDGDVIIKNFLKTITS